MRKLDKALSFNLQRAEINADAVSDYGMTDVAPVQGLDLDDMGIWDSAARESMIAPRGWDSVETWTW